MNSSKSHIVWVAIVVSLLWPASAWAQGSKVYRQVLPDGTVEYTDVPAEGATEQKLPALTTYDPVPLGGNSRRRGAGVDDDDSAVGNSYEEVAIASPRDDATVRANNGNVNVLARTKPALLAGHTLVVLLDGAEAADGNTSSFLLSNVGRGTHTVVAQVIDAAGGVVSSSPPVTFHVLRASVANRN